MRPRLVLLALLGVIAALLTTALTGTAGAATNPSPGPFPPGTNPSSCQLTAQHPYPVVLVHGTFENAAQNWSALAPYLEARGYCVYALNYGMNGTGEIAHSAQELKTFIESYVLPQSGAAKVDLVGHSQGGMMPRYYINHLGGSATVDELVGLSPSNHGTTNPGAYSPLACTACKEQQYESPFIQTVNSPSETNPNVDYTVVQTRFDEVVTPYTSAFLASDGGDVTNVTLQDKCPNNTDDHVATAYDPVSFQWIDNALSNTAGPANPGFQPVCA
jgi:triacylglycerol esterase/lipase EstA (alpha/beta hydrolase family)